VEAAATEAAMAEAERLGRAESGTSAAETGALREPFLLMTWFACSAGAILYAQEARPYALLMLLTALLLAVLLGLLGLLTVLLRLLTVLLALLAVLLGLLGLLTVLLVLLLL
jgi:uncharacterized membrane protein